MTVVAVAYLVAATFPWTGCKNLGHLERLPILSLRARSKAVLAMLLLLEISNVWYFSGCPYGAGRTWRFCQRPLLAYGQAVIAIAGVAILSSVCHPISPLSPGLRNHHSVCATKRKKVAAYP